MYVGLVTAQSAGSDAALPATFPTAMEESTSVDTLPQPPKEGSQLIQTIHIILKFVSSTLRLFKHNAKLYSCVSLYKLTTH